jgi:hypothetical protein
LPVPEGRDIAEFGPVTRRRFDHPTGLVSGSGGPKDYSSSPIRRRRAVKRGSSRKGPSAHNLLGVRQVRVQRSNEAAGDGNIDDFDTIRVRQERKLKARLGLQPWAVICARGLEGTPPPVP